MVPDEWKDFIHQKLLQFPQTQGQDVYKLLYQGVLGSEHLIQDRQKFAEHLKAELAELTADLSEQLFEPIRPDGLLCRINLRAWLGQGLQFEDLLADCFAVSVRSWGSQNELISLWCSFCVERPESFGLAQQLAEQGYPPVHHSAQYIAAYHPAYRLVMFPK
jgi:hypothetical protein